jgi:LysM domain/Bacterial SH3 domain
LTFPKRLRTATMPRLKIVVYFMFVFLCLAPLLAQSDDCPALVEAALKSVGDVCSVTGLNQACYGNVSLQAELQPGFESLTFSQPGDTARVASLRSLQLNPFDNVNKQWGVALMRLQANIPDTLPGQSVTFLLFGDVQLENKVETAPSTLITLTTDTVLRAAPQADAPLVGALSAGDKAYALSQSADGVWLRVERDGADSRTGWIPAALVPQGGELPIYDSAAPAPMQAFSLRTGVAGVGCDAAPQDGILVQTPSEDIKIQLTVNDVNIQLGSTAYLRAEASQELTVSVLEGQGQVEALGQTVDVPAGSWVKVPMDDNLEPTGIIPPATGYATNTLDNLPISLLPRPITIAPPIESAGQTLCVNNANGAWLREQPDSANQTIIRTLADGETVTVTGAASNDGRQDWLPVQTADGQADGWVEAAALTDCGAAPVIENCTPRADWTILYTVQPGNTMSLIAGAAGVSLNELAQANCIADVNRIGAGQQLRVPRTVILPTATPGATPIATIAATSTPELSSGSWQLTYTVQQVDCQTAAPPPPEVTSVQARVDISSDGQAMTLLIATPGIDLRRSGPNTFAGSVPSIKGSATLTVTGPNQGSMYVTKPCDPPVTS